MKYNRWYDKNENLRTLVDSLRGLNPNSRHSFALEIIQSALNKQSDKDDFLEELSSEVPPERKRWYDDCDVFQSAIIMLKYLNADEIDDLFKDIIVSMMCEDENFSR